MIQLVLLGLLTSNPDAPMDREKTLRLPGGPFLLAEFDRQTRDPAASLATTFPRPCKSSLDSSEICEDKGGLRWTDSVRHGDLSIHPLLGFEARDAKGGETFAGDGGVRALGGIAQASFYLDARIFSNFEPSGTPSYDGEYVERQVDGNASHFTYNSFSRYRSRLSLETPIGRVAAGRESENWGPSPFHALVLSQTSVPYNHLDWTIDLGPFTIRSLVADLAIQGPGESKVNEDTRTLFAHRYEWRATRNLTLGISEALILYNRDAPICFLPVVPLFAQKGLWYENINNGELAFDANWRAFPGVRFYGEFLIDDMNSPTTIFDDSWKSKWAATIGAQVAIPEAGGWKPGLIVEWSRVEPWVYTHYVANTSQALNMGLPLGSPLGPNSQEISLEAFGTRVGWNLGFRCGLVWKGNDAGSQGTDTLHDNAGTRKSFLVGADAPSFVAGPEVRWFRHSVGVALGFRSTVHPGPSERLPLQERFPAWLGRIEWSY